MYVCTMSGYLEIVIENYSVIDETKRKLAVTQRSITRYEILKLIFKFIINKENMEYSNSSTQHIHKEATNCIVYARTRMSRKKQVGRSYCQRYDASHQNCFGTKLLIAQYGL